MVLLPSDSSLSYVHLYCMIVPDGGERARALEVPSAMRVVEHMFEGKWDGQGMAEDHET